MIVKVVIPDSIYARVYFARGEQGPQGPQGIQGTPGATGATGPQGPAGANGTSYTPGDPIYVTVRNATGSVLNKGTIVYTSGANGIHTQVTPANNSSDATSARTLGWMAETVQNNSEGLCMVEGYLEGLATNGLTEGAQLYLSDVPGGFTQTKPVAPNHLVYVGVVAKASAGNGKVYVKVQNGYELDELHDVLITSPANNEVLTYESATGLWKNKVNAADGVTSLTALSPLTGGTITSTGSIGLNQTALSITQSQVSGLVTALAGKASTTHASTHASTGSDPVTLTLGQVSGLSALLDGKVDGTLNVDSIWEVGKLLVRPYSATLPTLQLRRHSSTSTGNIQEWEDETGNALAVLTPTGTFRSAGLITAGSSTDVLGQLSVITTAASRVSAVIRGAASQTADLLQVQTSAGTVVGGFTSAAAFFINNQTTTANSLNVQRAGTTHFRVDPFNNTFAVGTFSVGTNSISSNIQSQIVSGAAASVGLIVKGAASQSANLQEWQSSAGTILGSIDSSGQLRSPSVLNVNSFNNARIRLLDSGTVIDTGIAGNKPLTILNTNASPTANLTEWQNPSGTGALAWVTSGGILVSTQIRTANNYTIMSEANSGGFLQVTKATAQTNSPGANVARLYFRDGTNAGTLKLVVRAGAAGAETTILDNIPT